jgi:hypothetical protein
MKKQTGKLGGGEAGKTGAWCRMGGAFKKDERPTSNIQRPTSNEKTNWEAGRLGSWEAGSLE